MKRFARKLYAKFLPKIWNYPNDHLSAEALRTVKLPFSGNKCMIRKSKSDVARICEFIGEIYSADGYLNDMVLEKEPTVLLDIGGNIGLSTLAMIEKFPTLKKVIGVEAEAHNYAVLEQNYALWSAAYPGIEFQAIHAVAASSEDVKVQASKLERRPNLTASGTFRFDEFDGADEGDNMYTLPVVTLNNLLADLGADETAICKVDIEGGESALFKNNTEWLNKISFFTMELHDRFEPSLLKSSQSVIEAIAQYDFAVQPGPDVLHCYARRMFAS